MVVQTYTYLARNDIHFSVLGVGALPVVLFSLHFNMFRKEKDRKIGVKYLLSYFVNYKLSIIFLTELLLENIAMVETVGYSPYISKSKKDEEKKTWFERVKELIRLPETTNSFEEVLMTA
ncbi:hypothetical protein ABZ559_05195 [Streptococcus sp. ZY19097]|uniref:hypothetical protein n=1 Tax=Streptococcus sp. ZY19097 TaxID=3231906 RepID=UPI003459719D